MILISRIVKLLATSGDHWEPVLASGAEAPIGRRPCRPVPLTYNADFVHTQTTHRGATEDAEQEERGTGVCNSLYHGATHGQPARGPILNSLTDSRKLLRGLLLSSVLSATPW